LRRLWGQRIATEAAGWLARWVMASLAIDRLVAEAVTDNFFPAGASLHGCMSAHGLDADSTWRAMTAESAPHKLDNTLASMFETRQVLRPTRFALETPVLQRDYDVCWQGLERQVTRRE
jgi:homogentisate 1,2-dioxygenase